MEIRYARSGDLDGLLELLRANHVSAIPEEQRKEGFVTTDISKGQLQDLMEQENGVSIAADNGQVKGFALAGGWEFWRPWPLFTHMIDHLPEFQINGQTLTVQNSYQYGPVCVDKSVRGTGVFEKLFAHSLEGMSFLYPYMVTFINQVNPRSYAAHTRKAGMTECGKFDWNNHHYWLMAIQTKERALYETKGL